VSPEWERLDFDAAAAQFPPLAFMVRIYGKSVYVTTRAAQRWEEIDK
jgi:hypothetical protein